MGTPVAAKLDPNKHHPLNTLLCSYKGIYRGIAGHYDDLMMRSSCCHR